MQNIIEKLFLSLLFLIICFIYIGFYFVLGNIYINEIMPHSNNSWNDEWIEVYNNGSEIINLSGWNVKDNLYNDTFSLLIYPNSFGLIVDNSTHIEDLLGCNGFDITQQSCFELTTIGNGLNDEIETISLYDNENNLIDMIIYNTSIKSQGKSWNRNNSNLLACVPTPGTPNNCSQTYQNNTNSTNETNTTLPSPDSYIEILDYPDESIFGEEIDVDFHVYKGETGKYAVYTYVQNDDGDKVSEKITVHAGNSSSSSKFKDYYFEEKILLDCLDESREYELVIEGLDVSETRKIEIKKCKDFEIETASASSSKTEYFIENAESIEKIKIGEKQILY